MRAVRRRLTTAALLVLTGLTLSACRPRSESAGGKANVVIFLVDTLRADRLGSYGYGGGTSPHIEALGDAGVVFEQASAPAPWTLPSVASLLLSALPCEHNVLVDNDKIDGSARPLAALFKEAGYKTASFYTNPYAGEMSGLERGFDLSQHMDQQVDGRVVSSWLDGSSEAPFFLYIHNTEPHDPFDARPRFTEPFGQVSGQTRKDVEGLYRRYRSLTRADYSNDRPVGSTDNSVQQDEAMRRLRSVRPQIDLLYDAAILEADNNVGGVIAALRQAGVWDETLFIFLSDHGEEFDDHGGWQHDQSVYEELIRVPLIIRFPHDDFAGLRVSEPVSLLDVIPAIMDYLDRPELAARGRGRSLLPLVEGGGPSGEMRLTAMRHNKKKYYRPHKEERGDLNAVIRQGMWKGIWNVEIDTFELYDLARDPRETVNLSESEVALARTMRDFARSQLVACRAAAMESSSGREPELDEEIRRRLETLGYLDGGGDKPKR